MWHRSTATVDMFSGAGQPSATRPVRVCPDLTRSCAKIAPMWSPALRPFPGALATIGLPYGYCIAPALPEERAEYTSWTAGVELIADDAGSLSGKPHQSPTSRMVRIEGMYRTLRTRRIPEVLHCSKPLQLRNQLVCLFPAQATDLGQLQVTPGFACIFDQRLTQGNLVDPPRSYPLHNRSLSKLALADRAGQRASGMRSPLGVLLRALWIKRRTTAHDLDEYAKGATLKVTRLIRTPDAGPKSIQRPVASC